MTTAPAPCSGAGCSGAWCWGSWQDPQDPANCPSKKTLWKAGGENWYIREHIAPTLQMGVLSLMPTSRFAVFRSKCTMFLLCRYSIPWQQATRKDAHACVSQSCKKCQPHQGLPRQVRAPSCIGDHLCPLALQAQLHNTLPHEPADCTRLHTTLPHPTCTASSAGHKTLIAMPLHNPRLRTLAASRASLILTLSLVTKSAVRAIAALRLPEARYSVTRAGGRRALIGCSLRCLHAQKKAMVGRLT